MTDFKVPMRPQGAKQASEAAIARHRAEPAKRTTLSRIGARAGSKGKRAAVAATALAVLLGAGAAGQASSTTAHTADASKESSLQKLEFEQVGSNSPASPSTGTVEAKAAEVKPAEAPAPPAPPAPVAPAAAPAPVQPVAVDDPAGAQAYAAAQLPVHGWAPSEMQCLQKLWTRESDWKTTATNPSSGAYGVVQSLPARRWQAPARTTGPTIPTQINWGLKYVQDGTARPARP